MTGKRDSLGQVKILRGETDQGPLQYVFICLFSRKKGFRGWRALILGEILKWVSVGNSSSFNKGVSLLK